MLRNTLLLLLLRKWIDIFSKSGTLVNQQEIVSLLIFADTHFPFKMDILVCLFVNDCSNWYHKCGRQIVLFTVVVVETCEILWFFFFKKKLLLLKKHFEIRMLMSPENVFILCHSTVHPVNSHIIRLNDRKTHARCKLGISGQRGSGHKA